MTVETAHKTLADEAYSRLRHDVIQGIVAPGTKLRIEQLRRNYDVGATPLREALHRLSAEGFVEIEGQRGFTVAEMSARDLRELTDLRVEIEGLALRESLANADEQWESEIVAAFHHLSKIEQQDSPDPVEWEARNSQFHLALMGRCHSRWLMRLYRILYDQHQRYRIFARAEHLDDRDLHAEHQSMMEAALAHDEAALMQHQETHIRNTARDLMEFLPDDQEGSA